MTFQKRSQGVKTNAEATFLKRFCASWVYIYAYKQSLKNKYKTQKKKKKEIETNTNITKITQKITKILGSLM